MITPAIDQNTCQKFLFDALDIRGLEIRLTEQWQAFLQDRHYPPVVRQLMGELLGIALCYAAHLKQDTALIFQVKGNGWIPLLVLEVNDKLGFKGMAQWQDELTNVMDKPSWQTLFDQAAIVMTMKQGKHYYQSMVELKGHSLLDAFAHFSQQSDQTPTRFYASVTEEQCLLVQLQALPQASNKDADGWNRVQILQQSLTPTEWHNQLPVTWLPLLYAEETVQLFDAQSVTHDCQEDKEKYVALIQQLGWDEVQRILAEQGEITITNELCHETLHFSRDEVECLFSERVSQ